MSPSQKTILAFVSLLESKPQLFSPADWQDLEQFPDTLPEENEEISETIQNWLKEPSRQEIRKAFRERKKKLNSSNTLDIGKTLGPAGSQSTTSSSEKNPAAKELIANSIKNNSTLSNSETPTSSSQEKQSK